MRVTAGALTVSASKSGETRWTFAPIAHTSASVEAAAALS